MFRRVVTYVCFAYLLVAFGFILLAMLNAQAIPNASLLGNAVALAESDAQVIAVMSLIGLFATMVIALRMMIDGRYRRDLEQRALVPRRKSDIANRETTPD